MNLMVWFRKHNRKIMAFVVIALMIVFTIQPVMDYLSSRREGGHRTVATYDDGKKIKNTDLAWGQKQLELLKMLRINFVLQPRDLRTAPIQDLQHVFLGEVLFSERGTAADSISRIREIVGRNGYNISDKQIDDIYAKAYPSNIYWLLLTKEARLGGVRTLPETAKAQLETLIPQLFEGATYSQLVGYLVERQGFSEQQVLETFAELMGVIEYSRLMCSLQDATIQQMLYETCLGRETMDVEYVPFKADIFVEQAKQPGEEKITEQFEKYKPFFAGEVSEDNPYGFGYKLPDRAELEYIAVRLDDVAATEQRPTQQEMEDYYQQHLSQPPIAYMALSDPNDPNSQAVLKTRSYAEVAALISRGLYQQRVDSKAEQILLEAKSITEANTAEMETEDKKLTGADFERMAVSYETTAAELTKKHGLKVYTGRTGLLSVADIEGDKNLRSLYFEGQGIVSSSLSQIVFSIEQLKASELGPFNVQAPRLYENIGPLKDIRERMAGYSGSNMMLARVVRAASAAEPQSINEKISKSAVVFDEKPVVREDGNSVRGLVVDDLKRFAARDAAKARAGEFVREANETGWDAAIDKFNELYRKTVAGAEDDANAFNFQSRTGLRRISAWQLAALATRYEGDPMGRNLLDRARRELMLMNELYALVPEDANVLPAPGVIMEFKPEMSYYCVKSATINRLRQDEFDKMKAADAIEVEFNKSQSQAAVYYNPANIIKRTNFSPVTEQQETAPPGSPNDVNAVPEPEAKD